MSEENSKISLALPVPLRKNYAYLCPNSVACRNPGARFKVNFQGRSLIGICVEDDSNNHIEHSKLKHIDEALDQQASLPQELLKLCLWAADYYLHPLGEVLNTALSPQLRSNKTIKQEEEWVLTHEGKGLSTSALKRSPKQQEIIHYLLENHAISKNQTATLGFSSASLKNLKDKDLILARPLTFNPSATDPLILKDHDITAHKPLSTQLLRETPLTLNQEQDKCVHAIRYHQFQSYLLEGTTGSGKTEVYMHLAARVLQEGKQVLVLIPEIGLSPQTVERFRKRFCVEIAELHSNVSDGERSRNWQAAKSGKAKIIIGTRLAAFAPTHALGLIIIDEEHDNSYKQQDGFRYSARDVSIVRAKFNHIPIVLGSATPSLETLHNAQNNRYQYLRLDNRAGVAKPPVLSLIDLKHEKVSAGLSLRTLERIESTLARGQQVLVFLNRRGYAPYLLCHNCGWVAQCSSCSGSMTLHRKPHYLHCHHCDRRNSLPRVCPNCQHQELDLRGLGTEQTEEFLKERFADTPVIRIDRDSTRRKNALNEAFETLNKGDPAIIVGTQMLAKGHHFANLNLVIIIDADQGLFSPDFRGPEKMGQLLTQVSGRAGREQERGQVLIQSHHPEHPYFQLLLQEGYRRFAQHLLIERDASLLPPFWNLAVFRAESKRAENAIELLNFIHNYYQNNFPPKPSIRLIGPSSSNIEKIKERYRFQLLVCGQSRSELKAVLQALIMALESQALSRRCRWSLDIDPIEN